MIVKWGSPSKFHGDPDILFELIKENCLPELKEEVRKELCGKESVTTVKVLGGTSIKTG